jgi:hypothetical protein
VSAGDDSARGRHRKVQLGLRARQIVVVMILGYLSVEFGRWVGVLRSGGAQPMVMCLLVLSRVWMCVRACVCWGVCVVSFTEMG